MSTVESHPIVPGARSVDPDAARLLAADESLLLLVREAVQQMATAFDDGAIAVEYFVESDSDEKDERVFIAAYTNRPDRAARLNQVRKNWWVAHPAFASAPLALTAHGV